MKHNLVKKINKSLSFQYESNRVKLAYLLLKKTNRFIISLYPHFEAVLSILCYYEFT